MTVLKLASIVAILATIAISTSMFLECLTQGYYAFAVLWFANILVWAFYSIWWAGRGFE